MSRVSDKSSEGDEDVDISDTEDKPEGAEEDGDVDVSDTEAPVDGAEAAEALEEDTDKKKVDPALKKKSFTRKMYVLNAARLKGPKGIHTIENLYKGFKFCGKGHEKEDLDRVMKRLEYWAFRLFPKSDFDDFLDKCEHLGFKKELQTHLKRYRLGMISADDIMLTQDDVINDEADADHAVEEIESALPIVNANDLEFDRLRDETLQNQEQIS